MIIHVLEKALVRQWMSHIDRPAYSLPCTDNHKVPMVLHIWNSARRHYLFHHYLHAWITRGCSRRNGHQDWVMLGGNFFFLDHVLLMLSIQLTCIGKQPRICFGNIHWTSHCKLVNQASMSGVHLLFPCSSAILYFDGMQIQLGSGPGRPTESGWHVRFTLANVWLHLFLVPVGLHEISSEISEPGRISSLNGSSNSATNQASELVFII